MRSLLSKLALFFLLPFFVMACGGDDGVSGEIETDEIQAPPGYRLVWNDEFEGSSVDTRNWTPWVTGNPFNNELQYYTSRPDNVFTRDGKLVIAAVEEQFTGPDGTRSYTSARLNTAGKADFLYGRFEIRAKLPYGQGIWPAIWMLPTDNEYGGWPNSGEIDIMELVGHQPNVVHGTLHHTWPTGGHAYEGSSFTLPSGTFADDFHVFALEWEEGEMRWYIDGVQFRVDRGWATQGHAFPAPFDKRFHFLLNLAVGGDWPGSPNSTTVFPQFMEVDYVRAFEAIP